MHTNHAYILSIACAAIQSQSQLRLWSRIEHIERIERIEHGITWFYLVFTALLGFRGHSHGITWFSRSQSRYYLVSQYTKRRFKGQIFLVWLKGQIFLLRFKGQIFLFWFKGQIFLLRFKGQIFLFWFKGQIFLLWLKGQISLLWFKGQILLLWLKGQISLLWLKGQIFLLSKGQIFLFWFKGQIFLFWVTLYSEFWNHKNQPLENCQFQFIFLCNFSTCNPVTRDAHPYIIAAVRMYECMFGIF
jgi:hypothetical protein